MEGITNVWNDRRRSRRLRARRSRCADRGWHAGALERNLDAPGQRSARGRAQVAGTGASRAGEGRAGPALRYLSPGLAAPADAMTAVPGCGQLEAGTCAPASATADRS